jgi:hypothetical protein
LRRTALWCLCRLKALVEPFPRHGACGDRPAQREIFVTIASGESPS